MSVIQIGGGGGRCCITSELTECWPMPKRNPAHLARALLYSRPSITALAACNFIFFPLIQNDSLGKNIDVPIILRLLLWTIATGMSHNNVIRYIMSCPWMVWSQCTIQYIVILFVSNNYHVLDPGFWNKICFVDMVTWAINHWKEIICVSQGLDMALFVIVATRQCMYWLVTL